MENSFQNAKMLEKFKSLLSRRYEPLNRIDIAKERLEANYNLLSGRGLKVAPVLKSNAYGHGIVEVAEILERFHPPFFCVDSIYEAYQLYNAGIKTDILIMGYVDAKNLSGKPLPFSYAVFDSDTAKRIKAVQPQAGLHVFVDTGMHREGILMDELEAELKKIKDAGIDIEGIMSHCAAADRPENPLTARQIANFSKAVRMSENLGFKPRWKHIFASSGVINIESYSGSDLGNMARVGLALYGFGDPSLEPVLSMKSTLVAIKEISPGEGVGYDFSFIASKSTKIGIIPAGYHDGVDRRLSSVGSVSVSGMICPILGIVSMNQTIIDVSKLDKVNKGDEVLVFSGNGADPNSVAKSAAACRTIPYDLLVGLDSSTRRNTI